MRTVNLRTTLLRWQHRMGIGAAGCLVAIGMGSSPYAATAQTINKTGSLIHPRAGHTATLVDGNVLITGGTEIAELYDPATGTFSPVGSMREARAGHTATRMANGQVVLIGGGPLFGSRTAEIYSPAAGTFSETGSMRVARSAHTATLLPNGKVLVVGGGLFSGVGTAELYDPETGTFSATANLPDARLNHTATLLPSGKVLIAGGRLSSLPTAELYDPDTNLFRPTGSPNEQRNDHTATLLQDGRVLVTGTLGGTKTAEVYDPITGRFTPTGHLIEARSDHTAVLLSTGKALIVGGGSGSGLTELYDPRTGTFSRAGNLADPRSETTATLLPNGDVLIVGGLPLGSFAAYRSAEIYDPGLGISSRGIYVDGRRGVSWTTSGSGGPAQVGYGRIDVNPGSPAPGGVAIFGSVTDGVLVAEAGVPASAPVRGGRIHAEIGGLVNTGLALVNPNEQVASVSYYFTDADGLNFGHGVFVLGAGQQIARFLDQEPFNGASSTRGTFTFNSSVPVAVTALRGFTNQRSEFLITALPVASLVPAGEQTTVIPHYADGGGWTTLVTLVNPTDTAIAGTVQFLDQGSQTARAEPIVLTVNETTGSTFDYAIHPRSSVSLETSNPPDGVRVGTVRINPRAQSGAPSAQAIFSFENAQGVTVSQAGVESVTPGAAFRLYAEASGEPGKIGSIETGVAIHNTSTEAAIVELELIGFDGSMEQVPTAMVIPAYGHVSGFMSEVLPSLRDFEGVLRITSSSAPISVVGLRGRYNSRTDFLLTTTPALLEGSDPVVSQVVFPHIVDAGGWTTQFVLFGRTAGRTSTGTLRFLSAAGQTLNLQLAFAAPASRQPISMLNSARMSASGTSR